MANTERRRVFISEFEALDQGGRSVIDGVNTVTLGPFVHEYIM